MTNCHRARQLYSVSHEGEASAADTTFLDGHLESCTTCREEFAEFKETFRLLKSLPRVEASPEFENLVLARLRAAADEPLPTRRVDVTQATADSPWWSGWIPRFALAGAAAALLFAAVTGHLKPGSNVASKNSAARPGPELAAGTNAPEHAT